MIHHLKSKRQLMSLACFVLLIFWLCNNPPTANAETGGGMKEQAEKQISKLLGVPVSVSKYSLDYATIHLRGIKIGDHSKPELPVADIKKLSASCDFMSLLGGNLVFKEITISSLSARLTRDSSGNFVRGDIRLPATASLSLKSEDLPFEKILGTDLELQIFDEKMDQTLILRIPSANIIATASKMLVDLKGKVSVSDKRKKGKGDEILIGTDMRASGFIETGEKQNFRIEAAATVDMAALQRALPSLDDWLRKRATVSGKSTLVAILSENIKEPYLAADLKITDGAFALSEKQLDLKGISADIHAEGNISGPHASIFIGGTVKVPAGNVEMPISPTNKSAFTFPFKNMIAPFNYSGQTLTIKKAHVEMFGGTLEGNGTVQPQKTPISFQIDAQGKELLAEVFLAQNTSQKQAVSGPVNVTLKAAGNANGFASWNGSSSLVMRNGRYQAPPVVTPILSLVNLKEFASGDIKEANGTFTLHDGIMTTNDLSCLSTAGTADYRGDIGLDTTLNGRLEIRFSPTVVKKSQALQQISLDGKSAIIPTKVGGTILDPSFPGFSSGKLLELGLKRQGQKILQDIFKLKKKPATNPVVSPDPGKSPAPKPSKIEESLNKELKKLFKF
ncbi:MAG: hypothetical protein KKB51_15930 [Candidatus Riflebacteria bacterium]|nr:hypothetical protein [Candidatus Riflebacteria bacterium]